MLDTDERDRELDELRAENARLRAQGGEQREGATRHPRSWRRPVSALLLILGGFLLAAAVVSVWAARTLLDTDRYVETVAPLANDPAVRESVAVTTVDRLFSQADVENRVEEALPPRAAFVAPQISEGLRDFSVTAATRALSSPQFRTLWTEANRAAHQRVVPALLGETAGRSEAVSIEEGTVSIDMTRIVESVKSALTSRGLTIVQNVPPTVAGGTVTLFQSAQLSQIQGLLQAVQALSIALPILAVLALLAAVAVAPDRRRALLWLGATAILAMLAIGVGLALVRDAYVASPPAGILSGAAAVSFFDILVRFLRNAIRVVAALGLTLIVAAALAGPSSIAVRIRQAVASGSDALGLDLGRPAEWTDRHRRGIEVVIVVLAAIALFATDTPTPSLVLGLATATLVGFLLVELVAHSHPGDGGYRGEPSV